MRHRTSIAAGAVLGALSSSLAPSGCGVAVGREQATQIYEVTDRLTALEVRTGSGEVVVEEADRAGVHVAETLHWRGRRPGDGHAVTGGRLRLEHRCGDCSIDYRVTVPRGLDVRITTGSGAITLRGLTGTVDVSSGSGDIDARALGGRPVSASTGSGDVRLRFAAVPARVLVETGSGDGRVWVPQGTYHVIAETGVGRRRVEVAQDPSAPRTIVVRTGAGDAEVRTA